MKIFLFSIILRSKKPVQKFSTNGSFNTLKSLAWSNNTFLIQIDFMFITPISEGEQNIGDERGYIRKILIGIVVKLIINIRISIGYIQ